MKYLKSFTRYMRVGLPTNESTSQKEILNTIEDICLELKHNGFNVEYYNRPIILDKRIGKHRELIISKDDNGHIDLFNYIDVMDVVDRLRDYLGDNFIDVKMLKSPIFRFSNSGGMPTNDELKDAYTLKDVSEDSVEIRQVTITIKKNLVLNEGKQYSNVLPNNSPRVLEIINDIKDITLDLSDGPFEITHIFESTLNQVIINKIVEEEELSTIFDSYKYSEIKETMDRLFDYLGYGIKRLEIQIINMARMSGSTRQEAKIDKISISLERNSDKESYVNNQLKNSQIRELKLFYSTK